MKGWPPRGWLLAKIIRKPTNRPSRLHVTYTYVLLPKIFRQKAGHAAKISTTVSRMVDAGANNISSAPIAQHPRIGCDAAFPDEGLALVVTDEVLCYH